ncbi:MAG: DUF128 domain-containing protein [Candidatus Bathyarchaeia archaeon]
MLYPEVDRKVIEILKILSEQNGPIGARIIARKLRERGYGLDERTVRYHLRFLDERGLTKNLGYTGRIITEKGFEEVKNALVTDRLGFIITKIESLIFRMDFDLRKRKGKVIANVATLDREHFKKALQIIKKIILAGYCVSPYVKIAREGESLGGHNVPNGKVMIATLCSITLDGILHHSGIPVTPKFGGVVQVLNRKPVRFTELISYSGTTLDPLELFSAKGLNSILNVVRTGSGYVLANLREIPMDALPTAKKKLQKAEEVGIRGLMVVGEPNLPVLGVPVGINKVGIALIGGTNPLAGVSEAGIPIETKAIECIINFEEMTHINEL